MTPRQPRAPQAWAIKLHAGYYDCGPEASEEPHGPIVEMSDGYCIHFDFYMEKEAEAVRDLLAAPQASGENIWEKRYLQAAADYRERTEYADAQRRRAEAAEQKLAALSGRLSQSPSSGMREALKESASLLEDMAADCTCAMCARRRKVADKCRAALSAAPSPPEWRCFHCDFVAHTRAEAVKHFGEFWDHDPACRASAAQANRIIEEVKKLLMLWAENKFSIEGDGKADAENCFRVLGISEWFFRAEPPKTIAAPSPGEGEWRTIDSAPKDKEILAWPCNTEDGTVVCKARWYVHMSVEGWVTSEIDCGDFDFSPGIGSEPRSPESHARLTPGQDQ